MINSTARSTVLFVLIGLGAIVAVQAARYLMISWFPAFREGTWYATYSDFRLIHLQVNYLDHGYLRRGFVGTIFYILGVKDVIFSGWLLSLGSALSFLGLAGWVAAQLKPEQRRVLYVILIVMIFGPAGISQFVYDAGRIDHLLLPLAAFAVLAGLRGRLALSVALYFVMCLIHELSIIAFAPLLTVSNILGSRENTQIHVLGMDLPFARRSFFTFALATIAATAITVAYGTSPEAVQAFSEADGQQPLYSNMIWGADSPMHMISWKGVPTLLLAFYYVVLVMWGLMYCKSLSGIVLLLPISAVSCVLLNFVGVDAGRWAAISTWVLMVTIIASELTDRSILKGREIPRSFLLFGFMLALPVGPVGVTNPFNFVLSLIGAMTD